jgi:hypothetical protein
MSPPIDENENDVIMIHETLASVDDESVSPAAPTQATPVMRHAAPPPPRQAMPEQAEPQQYYPVVYSVVSGGAPPPVSTMDLVLAWVGGIRDVRFSVVCAIVFVALLSLPLHSYVTPVLHASITSHPYFPTAVKMIVAAICIVTVRNWPCDNEVKRHR